MFVFFFSSRRRHTRSLCDWSSDVCSSDLFVRHIGGHCYQFQTADLIHLIGSLEIGKLIDAGTAPGCPKTDECHVLRRIFAKSLQVVRCCHFQLYRFLVDLPERFRAGRGFLLPFCRAAENTRVLHGHFSVCQQRFDRIPGVLRVHHFLAIAVIDAAFVAQLAVFIEDEDVRSGLRAVGARDRTVKLGWPVCPKVEKASSKEKINRHIRFRPPFSYPRKSSLYVDDVTNLLRTFIPGAADTAPSLIPS